MRERRNKLQVCLWFGSHAEALPGNCYAPQPIWLPTAAGLFLVSGMWILTDMAMASCQLGDRFSPQNISVCGWVGFLMRWIGGCLVMSDFWTIRFILWLSLEVSKRLAWIRLVLLVHLAVTMHCAICFLKFHHRHLWENILPYSFLNNYNFSKTQLHWHVNKASDKAKLILLYNLVKKSERTHTAGWADWLDAVPMCWRCTASQTTGHNTNRCSWCHATCGHTVIIQGSTVMCCVALQAWIFVSSDLSAISSTCQSRYLLLLAKPRPAE